MSLKYWQKEQFDLIEKALTYKDLFLVANAVLKRMPAPVGQVCGPISTGGAGSVAENLKRFRLAIDGLQEKGLEIFDQTPFESPMQRMRTILVGADYDHSLLQDFYLPIFEQGLVHKLYFLPDWESSVGARWEHEQALRLGLDVEYI